MSFPHLRDRLVINLHGIGRPWDDVTAFERRYWCDRSVWLELADSMAEIAAAGRVPLEITFDDGNLSDFEDGFPALLERGLTATFFVCAGRIGEPRFMDVEHLIALREAGMQIGSHGWSHVDLRGLSEFELERESVQSGAYIAELLGVDVRAFALPFGSYDRRVLGSLRKYGAVYTSDWLRAYRTGWLTSRVTYANDVWGPRDLSRYAYEPYSFSAAIRRELAILYKRWR